MAKPALAFISRRKLHIHKDDVTREIQSEFEKTVRERAASIERRHAWKSQGRGAMFMGIQAAGGGINDVPVLLTGVTPAEDGGVLYSMETDAVSGIFLRDADGLETRLFHTADFRIRQVSLHPEGEMLAATVFHKDGMRANIAVLPVRGTDFSEVTEGDSFDQNPQWVPGAKRRIVFQSAGIGRNAAGMIAGLGPSIIQELDVDSRELEDVAQEDGHDLIQPRRSTDGSLYYIRKPYLTNAPDTSLLGSFKDAVLFPFRMGRAIFQYFNVFSMMYTGKPLVTSKGAAQKRMDPRQMLINANLARAGQAGEDEEQGLVPKSWELVRQASGGLKEVVAKGVVSFDLAPSGAVFYSDGAAISKIGSDGRAEKLLKAEAIEQVILL
jgi:hypothetical protein